MAGMTGLATKSSHKLGAFWEKTSCRKNSLEDAMEQTALGIVPERSSGSTACGTWRITASKIEMQICRKGKSHPS